MSAPAEVIRTAGLTKNYGSLQALQEVDLTVSAGEVFGFLGPNGAGKTTAIRLLTGFIKATSGHAYVFGKDAWQERVAIAQDLGFLPDSGGLDDGRTGEELLAYLTALQGRPAVMQRDLLERLDLSQEALRRRIKTYSQGMRQKLGLVQALQHDPSLVVLDEPTSGLDPLVQQTFFDLVRELRERGKTIFMSSHTLSDVERLCDRVGIVRDGRLVAIERVEDLRGQRIRRMEVVFSDDAAPDMGKVQGVVDVSRSGRTWLLTVQGDVNPVLRELARHGVEDLIFEQAHLEEIFLDYYREGSDS